MSNNSLIPPDIEEALLDWYILAEDTGDLYWLAERWETVHYSSFLKILFIRNLDPTWERKLFPSREHELDKWLRKQTGRKRLIVGYFTPRKPKEEK